MAWKLARSPLVTEIISAPGNPGMAALGECVPVPVTDHVGIVDLARDRQVDLVAVGPEDPLVAGLADRLAEAGIPVFGHSAAAARIEGSKAWANAFMARHGIPTARSIVATNTAEAAGAIDDLANGGPVVLKADGLMAGKGVVVAPDPAAAQAALADLFTGAAGETLVVEECLTGPEVSILLIVDGNDYRLLAPSCDHKRAYDGDEGPNTGGMGVYTPTARVDAVMLARIEDEIVRPAVAGMATEGRPLHGVLYPGLMLTPDGPKVIEFNARFGDPETQVVLPTTVGDLGEWAFAVANGTLAETPQPVQEGAAVGVAMASGGYPGSYETGIPITGIEDAEADPDVLVFHAGTKRNDAGELVTAGGRVLTVVGQGASLQEARDRAYAAVAKIDFDGKMLRSDIAARELEGAG